MRITYQYMLLTAFALLSACSPGGNAIVIQFEEQETGSEKYRSRVIVTPDFMRLDEGENSADFVLFDRKQRVIYSTNATDKRTLVIRWRAQDRKMPKGINNRVEILKESVPSIADQTVAHLRLFSNDRQCYDLFAAKDLMPKAVTAMIEFQQTLAVEHADFMVIVPLQTASVCDRVNNVYKPARYLEFGFPVYASDYLGRSRQLVDYKSGEKVDANLFKLPDGFEQYSAQDMRAK